MVQQAFRVDNLSTSNIEFKANSFVSSLVANTALASNVHLVLPGSVGTSGQVLATDGSGNLSFINQGIGGPADTVQDNVNATSANVNLVQSNVTSLTSTVDSFGIYANNTFGADGSNVSVANVTSQEFSLDGSTNTFTLVNSTDNVNKLLVSYGGIAQKPSEYQVSNTTLTLSNTRPLVSGTTLEVRFLEFEFAGSVTNTGNTGVVAGGSTTVIAPIAFGSVADITSGSGTNLNWANWNSNNATLDFTFDTPQPDTNYTVVTDCEVFDDAFVQITNKTTTGFRASFYDSSQNLQPSSFREFTFIVYGSTPTVDINSLSGTSYSTTLYSNLAAGTTTFNAASTPALATYTAGKIGVYRNGVKLPSTDYTASDGTSLILNNATLLGDSIEVVNFGTLSLALDDITDVDLTTNSPANGQALVYVSANSKWEPGTVASSYGNSDVDTHLNQSTATTNQVLSWDGSDYAWVDQSAGGASSGAALTEYEFTATANQTSFAATYIPNSIQVFLNGVKLANTDFTATNGTSVVLGANTASGDIVAISKIGGSSNLTVANASASGSGSISYDSGSEILTYTPPDLSGYQSTLVSNTNIKTINGTSLLGSGDISTGGGVAGTLGSLTKTFSNNETATITLSSNVSPVPNVSVFKEIPQPGVSSKGNWDVNANATNYDLFDEKPISYSNVTITPSATGDGTFTSSNPTILHNQFSLIPDHGTTQSTYATTGMTQYYINTGINDGASPQSSSVAVSPDGTKAIVLQWNTTAIGKQRLHSWNLQTAFGVNSAYVFQEGTGYDPTNSQWLHQGYYDVSIGGTATAYRFGHAGIDPSGVHFYFHRNTTTYYYKASTAWDVTTLSYQNKTFTPTGNGITASTYTVQGAEVSSNGSYLIYCSGNYVATYTMSTAFDASTASSGSKKEVDVISILTSAGLTVTGGLRSAIFNSDGTELLTNITYSGNEHKAYKFTLSTAWDITTASYVQNSESSNSGRQLRFFEQSNSDNTWVSYTVNGTADVAIVQLDESLQFNLNDVGKKVFGNFGSALITSTAGAYTSITPFADTSAISSWQLYGAEGKSDGTGISLTTVGGGFDIANASYDSKSLDVNAYESTARCVDISSDGLHLIVGGSFVDDLHYFTLSTAFDVSTATYVNKIDPHGTVLAGCRFSSTGHKVFTCDANTYKVESFDLSTAYDLSTAGSGTTSTALTTVSSNAQTGLFDFNFNNDGTKLFAMDRNGYKIHEYTLSTAWDITNLTYVDAYTYTAYSEAFAFNGDGTKLFILNVSGNDKVELHNLSVAFDISTASISSPLVSFDTFEQDDNSWGLCFGNSGQKMYVVGSDGNDTIYQYSTGSISHPYSQYLPALTNSAGQINSSTWTDINSMTADETKNGGDIFYAVSTDNRTSWAVVDNTNGVRNIVKNNSGTWQYNNSASYSSEIWVNGTNNNEHATLQQALGAQSFNRMNKAQLDAVTDANHYTLGNTLDLMIAPYATSGISPLSDGVTINYDAEALVEQAINGTDYKARFPTANSVSILSLADQNLKVRVI